MARHRSRLRNAWDIGLFFTARLIAEKMGQRHRGMSRSIAFCLSSGLALALLTGGCAGSRHQDGFTGGARDEWLERPPPFMTGPAAVFLTNLDGFSAQATITIQTTAAGAHTISGQLLERQGKLFFEPIPRQSAGKHPDPGQFSFIWDIAAGRGYVLSEALQGYAPVGSAVRFAPPAIQSSAIPMEPFQDHPVNEAMATYPAGNASPAAFHLLCARDLNGLALRIESTNEPVPFTLTLSKVRIDRPAEGLFEPPEGFTKYQSEEALLDELASREQSLRGSPQERHSWAEPEYPGRSSGRDTGPGNRLGP